MIDAEGIATSLYHYGRDESVSGALNKAERWRDVLEEMQEVATEDQRKACARLLNSIRHAINTLVDMKAKESAKEVPHE